MVKDCWHGVFPELGGYTPLLLAGRSQPGDSQGGEGGRGDCSLDGPTPVVQKPKTNPSTCEKGRADQIRTQEKTEPQELVQGRGLVRKTTRRKNPSSVEAEKTKGRKKRNQGTKHRPLSPITTRQGKARELIWKDNHEEPRKPL